MSKELHNQSVTCKHSLSILESKRGEIPKRYWCTSCGLKYTKEIIIKEIEPLLTERRNKNE